MSVDKEEWKEYTALMFDLITDRETRVKLMREKMNLERGIRHETEKIILQSIATLLFFTSGVYYAQRNSIMVPLIMAPAITHSTKELTKAISNRKQQLDRLKQLSRE